MKQTFISIILFIMATTGYSQAVKNEAKTLETKMDIFSSKTGTITKFIDSKLPNLKLTYSTAETRVRKLISGTDALYFYQVEYTSDYSTTTASIEYSDLLEVIKALTTLKSEIDKDIASNPDYLENKFTTKDGFQLGYYIDKGKSSWFMKLEKYGSKNTIFFKDGLVVETALNEAKAKIEELKK